MHCILLLWESQEWRLEPNILTWCSAAYRRAPFPQSLPRFHPSDRRICAHRKEHTPYSAVSASGIFTPFLCASREITREAVFLNMPIFTCKLIMNLLSDFVNIFTQKIVKIARTEAYRTVLILSTHFPPPCSNRFCNSIFHPRAVLF